MNTTKIQNQERNFIKEGLLSGKIKRVAIDIISYLFVSLFIYTASSKVMTFGSFSKAFVHSVVLADVSAAVAVIVIVLEILISVLLIIPKTERFGLFAALLLMLVFTGYLVVVFVSGQEFPCSCGGIVSSMSWSQHIWFNLVFILLAVLGLKFYIKH